MLYNDFERGGAATSIADSARLPHSASAADAVRQREWANRHLKLPPERAGEIIVEAIERRRALLEHPAPLASAGLNAAA